MRDAKILFVTPNDSGGGAERHIFSLAKSLDDNFSLDVEIAVMLPEKTREVNYKKTHYIGSLSQRFPSAVRATASFRALVKLIDQIKPTTIYSCLDWSNIIVGLIHLFSRRSFYWIAGLQNPLIARSYSSKATGSLRYLLHDFLLRRADKVIVPSSGLVGELIQLGIKQQKIAVIPNVVAISGELQRFCETENDNTFHLGFCARLVPQKNPFAVLRLIEKLQDSFTVELHIVGAGPLEHQMRQFCNDRGLSEKVHFYGCQHEPWRILNKIDIFILTSLYEGFGNVLVEAMNYGKPIVAYDAPYGPREIIEDRKTGFLVEVGDEIAFEQAVKYILENGDIRTAFSESGNIESLKFLPKMIAKNFSIIFTQSSDVIAICDT